MEALGVGILARRLKESKLAKKSSAVAGPSSTQASSSRVVTCSSKASLVAPDMDIRRVSDSSVSAMKTSISHIGLGSALPSVHIDSPQASGSRIDTQNNGFRLDAFFQSLAPYAYDPIGPRPMEWEVDAALARLEYVKASEQYLARPIQDMIDRRAQIIDRMLADWRSVAPSRIGYQEEGIQASSSGKGKQKASPIEPGTDHRGR